MNTKKLTSLFLRSNESERTQLTNSGAAVIANHADSLKFLWLGDLDVTTVLHGNKALVNLEHLQMQNCSGSLDSILGICRKLEVLKMVDSEMIIGTQNFSLPSLKFLILEGNGMSAEDDAKLIEKLPDDMIRNDLMDDDSGPPPPPIPEA